MSKRKLPSKQSEASGNVEMPRKATRPRGRKRPASRLTPVWRALAIPIPVLIIWEVIGQQGLLAGGMFPPLSTSIEALVDWVVGGGTGFFSGQFADAWINTLIRVFGGFAIGASLAIVLGMLSGTSTVIRQMIDPMINILRPISITAWVPLALIIFGLGNQPAFFLVALATFYPMFVNVASGARFSEGRFVHAARMLGASRWQVLYRVTLPATLPSIAVGMRVSAAIAWTAVIVAEMLGARSGLGYSLIFAYSQFQFEYVIAAMIGIGLSGWATDKLLEYLIQRRLRWVSQGAAQ